MTNSREKFEAWFYAFYEPEDWRHIDIEKSYAAWLAGREAMRDEAAEIADSQINECGMLTSLPPQSAAAYTIRRLIKEIQP